MRENFILIKKRKLFVFLVIAVTSFLLTSTTQAATSPALQFNGSSSYVLLPSINAGTAFSLEAWFKISSPGDYLTLFKDDYISGFFGSVYVYYDHLEWWHQSIESLSINNVNVGVWHHFVLTSDGSITKLYLNGVEKASGNFAPVYNNDLEIGYSDAGGFWDGGVDEVRLYSRTLSASEVAAHYSGTYSNEQGLEGFWAFNEGSGIVAGDSSGNNYDGNIYNATWTTRTTIDSSSEVAATLPIANANHAPNISFSSFPAASIWKGVVAIKYNASDDDSAPFNLSVVPIGIYYSNNLGVSWQELSKNEANSGKYDFDTTKFPDGEGYMLRLSVTDNAGAAADVISDRFSIDNTPPSFQVFIVGTTTIKENDEVSFRIVASENLPNQPEAYITQQDGDPIKLSLTGTGKTFFGSYSVRKGKMGIAVVSARGVDATGNVGDKITIGRTFSVDRLGPPPPIFTSPLNNESLVSASVVIKGNALGASIVEVTHSNTFKATALPDSKGNFEVQGVVLNTTNRGLNTIVATSIDQAGLRSEESFLNVKLNSRPSLVLKTQIPDTIAGVFDMSWDAEDKNGDQLTYVVSYSTDQGVQWYALEESNGQQPYRLDTTKFFDGQYKLKISANDGTATDEVISKVVTIKNEHILQFNATDFKFNTTQPLFEGAIRLSGLQSMRYSFNNKDWLNAKVVNDAFTMNAPSALVDGTHNLFVEAKTGSGKNVRTIRTFIVDTVLPVASVITSPAPNTIISSDDDLDTELGGIQINVGGTGEAGVRLELVLNDRTYTSIAGSEGNFVFTKVNLLSRGINTYTLTSVDSVGNTSTINSFIVTNNVQEISILSPQNNDFIGKIKEISWTTSGSNTSEIIYQIVYRAFNENWTTLVQNFSGSSYQWDVSKLRTGSYELKVVGNDALTDSTAVVNVIVDNDPPQLSFSRADSEDSQDRIFFIGTAVDEFSKVKHVEYTFDDKNWYKALVGGIEKNKVSFAFYNASHLEDGEYEVKVRAADWAGNSIHANPIHFTVDTTPPRIGSSLISSGALILSPNSNGVLSLFNKRPYKIVMSASPDTSDLVLTTGSTSLKMNFNKAISLWEAQLAPDELGDYVLSATAKDFAGNISNREIIPITVLPPGKIFNQETKAPIQGAKVTLFVFDQNLKNWLVWDAKAYNQNNPSFTNDHGEYDFFVPPGVYRIDIKANGFEGVKSKNIEIKENYPIYTIVPMLEKKGIINSILRLW